MQLVCIYIVGGGGGASSYYYTTVKNIKEQQTKFLGGRANHFSPLNPAYTLMSLLFAGTNFSGFHDSLI